MKNFIFILSLTFLFITGCESNKYESTTLPNDYVTSADKYISQAHPGSYNIRSREEDLVTKSRIVGTISYLGFLNVEDNALSINNISQNAYGRNGDNDLSVFDDGGVIIKVLTSGQVNEYIFQLKSNKNELSPAISLKYLKEGDKISIPTIREYENSSCQCGSYRPYRWYRILNQVDYIYIHEINTVASDTTYIRSGDKL